MRTPQFFWKKEEKCSFKCKKSGRFGNKMITEKNDLRSVTIALAARALYKGVDR